MVGLPSGRPTSKEARGHRSRSALLTFSLAMMVSAAVLTAALSEPARPLLVQIMPRAPASTGTNFDYLVIILMENHNLCDILTSCGGSATYMSNLADAWGLAQEDRYCNVNPSLPNYLCLTGGSDFGCSDYDGAPNSNGCTSAAWAAPNIVDRLVDAGLTWKAYMEDMPSNCYGSDSGDYAVRHNPFVYYSDIALNTTRCNRVVPAGSSDSALIDDLASTSTASNYMWLTPNKCNDIHSCPVETGDAVPPTITIDVPSNHSSASSTLTVRGSAFDNIAIRAIEVRVDGGPWMPASGTTSWTASLSLAVGNHTIDARATDFAGNQKTVDISLTAQAGIDLVAFLPEIAAAVVVAVVIVAVLIRRRRKKTT